MELSKDMPNPKFANHNYIENNSIHGSKNDDPKKQIRDENKIFETAKEVAILSEEEKNKINNKEKIDEIKGNTNNIIQLPSKNEEKPLETNNSINSSLNPKEEEKNKEKDNDKKEEEQISNKENNSNDFAFQKVNNNIKLEESKNVEVNSSYKIYPKDFTGLNMNYKNNYIKYQNKFPNQSNNSSFNIIYFNPITFSCSIDTYSMKKSKLKPMQKEQQFFEKIIKIADISNVNEFWEVFQHLKKPNQCPTGSDYHVFKKGIFPMWEDKLNMDGGKLSILLTKKYANVIWEEVIFNFTRGFLPYYDYINGIIISMRPKFMVLSFWIKCSNNSIVEKIRNALSGLLQTPSSNCMDFIPFH